MKEFRQAATLTAIKTPYLADGKFDLAAYDRLVERQIEGGIDGLIVGGTTGEGHLMGWDEHIMLIAHTVHRFGNRLLVVGNTGSNNTREAVKATSQGFAVGMDAALQINPYYGKTSLSGLRNHFGKVLELGPAVIYNVPGRTGQDLNPELIKELANHPNLLGIKECAGTERIAQYEKLGISCWSGNDDQAFTDRHQAKSHGVISVASNLLPKTMKRLMTKPDEALNQRLQPFFSWLFCEPNPIALNTATAMLGMAAPVFRLPYVPLSLAQRQQGLSIMRELSDLGELGEARLLADRDFTCL
ncbi:MAG: 4-hydroxy-tetrahydrodipicolinate synthase [Candidatus Lambdaproteobacteria bacterium RIFOXYD2_FULL_50_16]|uniref:4-hydroxy-tetrahydrodipicolinate synthase n=1 Tax=Candidatus Lambdaproteobacteria bacterium RIFOXYD2_FULL_50_16 TaxID=1817772 RepID=A0A1F6G6D1_9PROT|nr:MAG: 4-hydroxy-tetrahydrodipicolinate synthase [Candidatus Lambdaproteobacteria bacterium RIFOXYD2_FULL_50_16]